VADQAIEQGSEGLLEDTLAAVRSWEFRPDAIRVPALIMHGAKDKMVPCAHGEWLAARCLAAELRIVADAGHITVLDSAPEALAWLAARVRADACGLAFAGPDGPPGPADGSGRPQSVVK
jgi:pimeloyl-ACP methyl ester carboxylesterase